MGAVLFLSLRALHVLLAAIWIGSTVFITMLLMPAAEATGASGGAVMTRMVKGGGLIPYMAILGGTTVLTGIYLFWRLTGGFDPVQSASMTGRVYGAGGLCGIIAAIIGGSIVGKSAEKNVKVMEQAAATPAGPARDALLKQGEMLRQRMKASGNVVVALQVVALVLMAIGHYV